MARILVIYHTQTGNTQKMAEAVASWEETWIAIFGLFAGVKIKYFDSPEFENAWKWINENS